MRNGQIVGSGPAEIFRRGGEYHFRFQWAAPPYKNYAAGACNACPCTGYDVDIAPYCVLY